MSGEAVELGFEFGFFADPAAVPLPAGFEVFDESGNVFSEGIVEGAFERIFKGIFARAFEGGFERIFEGIFERAFDCMEEAGGECL